MTFADLFLLAVAFVLVALAVWAVAEITVFLFGLQASQQPDEVGYACPRCNGALDAYDDGTLECATCGWPESDIKRVRGASWLGSTVLLILLGLRSKASRTGTASNKGR